MATKGAQGRMLPEREYEKHLLCHRKRMQNVGHQIDDATPAKYSHLEVRLKQMKMEEQRQAEIDKNNKLLLQRMTAIMMARDEQYKLHKRRSRSMNIQQRQREHDRLMQANVGVAKRIERVQPFYRVDKWEADYRYRRELMDRWNKKPQKARSPPRSTKTKSQAQTGDKYESDFESDSEEEDRKERRDKLPPIRSVGNRRAYN